MLTSIDVKFIFDSACLLVSLGDKGVFSSAIIPPNSRCCPSSCLLAVLAMFLANSFPIFPSFLYSLPNQLNTFPRSSRVNHSIIWPVCCMSDIISGHIAKFFQIWLTVAGYDELCMGF